MVKKKRVTDSDRAEYLDNNRLAAREALRGLLFAIECSSAVENGDCDALRKSDRAVWADAIDAARAVLKK